MTRAILFDVDFTLIYPGPTFQGEGYRSFAVRHGMTIDPARFEGAVASAGRLLEVPDEVRYDDALYIGYTRHIIEQMGGEGDALDACAREIYAEWAACQHFELYEDVPSVLRALKALGLQVGLVSNSHRCLDSFQSHFDLGGLIDTAVSSSEHGWMKPHPSIFRAALERLGVPAADTLMVGDSIRHDIEGALQAGLQAALLHRDSTPHPRETELRDRGVAVLRSLRELQALLERG